MDVLRKAAALVLVVLSALTACAADRYQRVTIVHTNDLHGHVEKAPAMAAVAQRARAANPHTLFLDAGDCITGTPISTLYQGRPIFEIISLMGYDAVAIGNHEFDHGWPLLREFQELCDPPLLCANARDPEGRAFGDAPYRVFELGGVRVGVIGLVTEQVPTLTVKKASAGCTFGDPIAAARELVPKVRKECDVVVLLTHVGVEHDAALAGAVEGIDLIVGGHSHTELKEPLEVNGTRIVQASSYGRRVGIVELYWDREDRRLTNVQGHLVKIDPRTMPNAPLVKKAVDAWESKVAERVSIVIGRADRKMGRKALRSALERIYRDVLETDFGYQNTGGIRADLAAGEISVRDVWTILPFDNTLVRMRLKGEQLTKYMRGRLGDRFDPEREYVIGTNSYVGDQQKKYFGTHDVPVEDTGLMMRDVVEKWVRENGGFARRAKTTTPAGGNGKGE